MKDPDFGFTNLYLKTGVILVSVAAVGARLPPGLQNRWTMQREPPVPLPTGDNRIVMSTSPGLRNRVGSYIRSHPREVRLLAFLAVLFLVWMLVPNIEALINGFLDGLQEPGSQ